MPAHAGAMQAQQRRKAFVLHGDSGGIAPQQVVGGFEGDGVDHAGAGRRSHDQQRTVVGAGSFELGQGQGHSLLGRFGHVVADEHTHGFGHRRLAHHLGDGVGSGPIEHEPPTLPTGSRELDRRARPTRTALGGRWHVVAGIDDAVVQLHAAHERVDEGEDHRAPRHRGAGAPDDFGHVR